ncbi:hypothetical protein [Intrasporangium calvum]|uniref:Uncharacterized protein n=1 Tax=Intrasporangium calvum (strain ATCC 23552 / DSM 43043 / JCM 3097 / NBRC 12989 / NCIMB 10167 / NRRL B-3866 / 7 KIP) TaxID=710696 RepID=E6S907_INTC7|nr:hypothetical protein [Intrasporangium calvum]ADU49182.1 hypothetical protein Intca_2680 [Intrasporangium calvum DSM 43043]
MTHPDLRQWQIRTMPDWALSERAIGGPEGGWVSLWGKREGIDPPPTPAELANERARRAECERLNASSLPSVLAEMPDLYFIPSIDGQALRSLIDWLWNEGERRMHLSAQDLDAERRRRGIPTMHRPGGKPW